MSQRMGRAHSIILLNDLPLHRVGLESPTYMEFRWDESVRFCLQHGASRRNELESPPALPLVPRGRLRRGSLRSRLRRERKLVERKGVEPSTSALRTQRSPN